MGRSQSAWCSRQGHQSGVEQVAVVSGTVGGVQKVGLGLHLPQQTLVSQECSGMACGQGAASVNRVVQLSLGRLAE